VNQFDQVVIGMNGSSEQDFVAAYAAVGETLGSVTSFGDPLLLQAGLADYERIIPVIGNFWGQYSATAVAINSFSLACSTAARATECACTRSIRRARRARAVTARRGRGRGDPRRRR